MQLAPVKNVLVVEPNPELKNLLARVLKKGVWAITEVLCNQDALAAVGEREYDLVITGAGTSAAENIELSRKMRSLQPHAPVIILTCHTTHSDVLDSIRAHAFTLFTVPYREDRLAEIIRYAVESHAWEDGIEVVSAFPRIRICASCRESTAIRLVQFFNELTHLPAVEREQVGNAFRELLLNAIEHGCQLDPRKQVEVRYMRNKHRIACRIADHGPGFNLNDIPHAAIGHPIDDPLAHIPIREQLGLRPGGFGIRMSKDLVDKLIYNKKGNEVLLVKYLKAEAT